VSMMTDDVPLRSWRGAVRTACDHHSTKSPSESGGPEVNQLRIMKRQIIHETDLPSRTLPCPRPVAPDHGGYVLNGLEKLLACTGESISFTAASMAQHLSLSACRTPSCTRPQRLFQ
jgi:hypothetical protein